MQDWTPDWTSCLDDNYLAFAQIWKDLPPYCRDLRITIVDMVSGGAGRMLLNISTARALQVNSYREDRQYCWSAISEATCCKNSRKEALEQGR